MYLPSYFEESRPERLHPLIEAHPLGILVTNGSRGLDANHLPFELNSREGSMGVLHTHVARANSVWQDVTSGDEVLVVFRGADAYISPNWYPSTQEEQRQVPTWNYIVVHAHGRVTVHDDEQHVRGVVARLTKRHEGSEPRPWKMGERPETFIKEKLASIVALEIEISRLIGKFKLGQNRAPGDVIGAAEELKSRGNHEVANAMLAQLAERSKGRDR